MKFCPIVIYPKRKVISMKKKLILISVVCAMILAGCGANDTASTESKTETTAAAATAAETTAAAEETTAAETTAAEESKAEESGEKKRAPEEEVGYEGMQPVTADKLKDGEYEISVDSSSSLQNSGA